MALFYWLKIMNRNEEIAVNKLIDKSLGVLKIFKIENTVNNAMPDLICENRKGTAFFIEAKHLVEWPKRDSTFPLRSKFEKGQQAFGSSWVSWGGHDFCFLKVGAGRDYEFYLLPFNNGRLSEKTKDELIDCSIMIGLQNIIDYLGALK